MDITVNGEHIPAAAWQHELSRLRHEFPNTDSADIEEMAQRNLIDQLLIAQEAERRFTDIPQDELDTGFNELVDRHGGYDEFYQKFNLTEKDNARIKKDIARQIKVRKFLDALTADVPPPSDEEVRTFYEEHREELIEPQQVHAAHIVRQPSPENATKTFEELKEIRSRLMEGAEFDQIVDEQSLSGDSGGDLGFFSPGKMVEEFDVVVFSMLPGEVSPVFRTSFGYHVAKVYETKPPRLLTFEEAANRIRNRLHYDLKNDHIGVWVDTQRDDAEITISSGALEGDA